MCLYTKKILSIMILLVAYFFLFFLHSAQAQEGLQSRVKAAEEVKVPAGKFWWLYRQWKENPPPAEIYLDEFYIDVFQVSISDYAHCVQLGQCSPEPFKRFIKERAITGYPNNAKDALKKALSDPYPMNYVTFDEALKYCASQGKRLPTNAEWIKAALGFDNTNIYPLGEKYLSIPHF